MKYLVCDKIFSGAVAFYNGGHHVLRDILEISQELFGVLWQAVAAIAKRWIVVMSADPWIQADPVYDLTGVQSLGFGIGVQFIEIGDTKGQVGVGEELYSLRFCKSHKQSGDILFDGALLEKGCENMCFFLTLHRRRR